MVHLRRAGKPEYGGIPQRGFVWQESLHASFRFRNLSCLRMRLLLPRPPAVAAQLGVQFQTLCRDAAKEAPHSGRNLRHAKNIARLILMPPADVRYRYEPA